MPAAPRVPPLAEWPYAPKWLVVGSVIGAVAGLAALGLRSLLAVATRWLLTGATGTRPATLAEGGTRVHDVLSGDR